MSNLLADPPTPTLAMPLAGYQLRLPSFEGPLDVLLRLVERDQLPIAEVSLVAVTDHFLAHLAELGDIPPETVADFAAVGARLVLLKTRSLLPRPVADEHAAPDQDDLVQQLSEYQRIRVAAQSLAERDRLGSGAFARGRGVAVPVAPSLTPLAAHQPSSLVRALRRRLTNHSPPPHPLDRHPTITLRAMIERVLDRLSAAPSIQFGDALSPRAGRSEAMTAFLAVLVLVRRRVVDADQPDLFGAITLRPAVTQPAPQPVVDARSDPDEFAADD